MLFLLTKRLVFFFTCLCVTGTMAQDLTRWIESAHVEETISGQVSSREIKLPFLWDVEHPQLYGTAIFRIQLPQIASGTEPVGIYFSKIGNSYEVWLNGQLLERRGDITRSNGPDFGKVPRLLKVQASQFGVNNQLEIRIAADPGRKAGLSRLAVGPIALVEKLYNQDSDFRVTFITMAIVFSCLVGLFSMALWITQPVQKVLANGRDPTYLFCGLAELFWALRVSDVLVETPPISWPFWGVLPVFALAAWASCTSLFCMEILGWNSMRSRFRYQYFLAVFVAMGTVLSAWALLYQQPWALTLWYGSLGAVFLVFGAYFMWRSLKARAKRSAQLLAIAIVLNVLAGVMDLYSLRLNPTSVPRSNLYYVSIVFGCLVAGVLVQRFRSVTREVHDLMGGLEVRVRKREEELAKTYQQLELLALQEARTLERSRILRDMHDGVGAHISTAIRQLQSGKASEGEILNTLRDSLDQLKLSIDAMNLPAGDITALLANLRYRLEPRLRSSDIELQWQVDVLENCPRLDDKAMRHLLFMVYEAISNVLQHAQASVLRIESVQTTAGSRISLTDNGKGFDVDLPKRRGLQSMHERAQAIGAELTFQSAPGQTVVSILIPQ